MWSKGEKMKTELRYGMLHTVYTGESIIEEIKTIEADENGIEHEKITQIEKHGDIICSDPKCGRLVRHNECCFVDAISTNGNIYCDSCGKCIRFSRKREATRKQKA